MPSKEYRVKLVLEDLRMAIQNKRCIPTERKINLDTLALLGWLWDDAFDEMQKLTFADYVAGLVEDEDYPLDDDLWIFKRIIQGYAIYIKFKVRYLSDGSVLVISFHIDR